MEGKTKVAIACQGGGSQTAFTAGVLASFFKHKIHEKYDIVSLSGTSGGAVNAALAWYGMLKAAKGDNTPIEARIEAFWEANSTQNLLEDLLNDSMVSFSKMVGEGILPEWKTGPTSPFSQAMTAASKVVFPRFLDLSSLLETFIKFEEIPKLVTPSSPVLLIGAANVKTGEFKKFSSINNEITVKALLASAAVPSLFPAVKIEDDYYWDGLFSDNPPTNELIQREYVDIDKKPDQLWVIQINPRERQQVPTAPEDILDRRNEMIGNGSLFQDLEHIEMVNKFLRKNAFKKEFVDKNNLKCIEIFTIQMSEPLLENLDYASKLDRKSSHIQHLIADGEKQAQLFLQDPENMRFNKNCSELQ